jgi:hypothetical protein
MSVDFQQVRQRVNQIGENATQRLSLLQERRQQALDLLRDNANSLEGLHQKVQQIVRSYDPDLRCAAPAWGLGSSPEPLDGHYPPPAPPARATLIAVDGSQIFPDRNASVNYCLINIGSIQMHLETPEPPAIHVQSRLMYEEELYTPGGMLTDSQLSLRRDLEERQLLIELTLQASPPVITFTDGPLELWGVEGGAGEAEFRKSREQYLAILSQLFKLKATTAGYVDKPAANLLVRLLEIAMLPPQELPKVRESFPLRGVIDRYLLHGLLEPGERSAVFKLQSGSARHYRDESALHFFYLNVGRPGHPWLSRVEIPAWVAENPEMLGNLHAVLVQQGRMMGSRPYPYLLHRAHETAVVKLEEKEQVTQMIVQELHRRSIEVGEVSYKQSAKDLQGRTRYE